MNFKKIDVVTCFYKDIHKLNWKNLVEDCNLIIYKKNDDLNINESFIDNENYINIPNFGRCDYAFFWHIIKNYNTINNITIFTKINWFDQSNNFPYLLKICSEYDFIEVGDQSECYNWHNGEEYESNCINININDTKNIRKNWHETNVDSNIDWYNYIFGKGTSPGKIRANAHGPVFSVSKNLICRHPVSVYEYLLERFHMSWNIEVLKKIYGDNPDGKRQGIASVGHHYHDELVRFYKILFTHRVNNIKIKQ